MKVCSMIAFAGGLVVGGVEHIAGVHYIHMVNNTLYAISKLQGLQRSIVNLRVEEVAIAIVYCKVCRAIVATDGV
mgnify:CR=1 FL=1